MKILLPDIISPKRLICLLFATLSHDKKWVAATFTSETGNLWTNPERSCQHADPEISLNPNETKALKLTTFIYRGGLDMLFNYIADDKKRYASKNK